LDNLIDQSEKVLQKKNPLTRKIDHAFYERIVKEFCPNNSLEDMMSEDLIHEFTFVFRLLMLNIPNFEVEIQLISFQNDDQTIKYMPISQSEFLEYPQTLSSSCKNARNL
jgi:hypothetical protein